MQWVLVDKMSTVAVGGNLFRVEGGLHRMPHTAVHPPAPPLLLSSGIRFEYPNMHRAQKYCSTCSSALGKGEGLGRIPFHQPSKRELTFAGCPEHGGQGVGEDRSHHLGLAWKCLVPQLLSSPTPQFRLKLGTFP